MTVSKVGSEFKVNPASGNNAQTPRVTSLVDGGFAVTWSGSGGRAEVFDGAGALVSSLNLPNGGARLAGLEGGGYVAVWEVFVGGPNLTDIKAQIYSASGVKIGAEFRVNPQGQAYQYDPSVAALPGGGFVVTWGDEIDGFGGTTGNSGLRGQIFTATGAAVGAPFKANAQPPLSGQREGTVTTLSNGGFVVSWTDFSPQSDGSNSAIKAQVFSADAAKVGSELVIKSGRATPSVAALPDGGFVVTWTEPNGPGSDGSGSSINAQLFNADGVAVGSEFVVNSKTLGDQVRPNVASFVDGVFVITWTSQFAPEGDGDNASVKAQAFYADGTKLGSEFLVNTTSANSQDYAVVAALANGKFAVIWQDNSGVVTGTPDVIRAQLFDVTHPPYFDSNGAASNPIVLVEENTTAVTTVHAIDLDPEDTVTYAMTGGADRAKFQFDEQTGELRFITPPNFEAPLDADGDNIYEVIITATSGTLTDTQTIRVSVQNVNEAIGSNGGLASASISVIEKTTAVTTVYPSQGYTGTALSYSLGGTDAALFQIDAATGELTFKSAPDARAPGDAGHDNTYNLFVKMSSNGVLVDTQSLAVKVLPLNIAPEIAANGGLDLSLSIGENTTAVTTVMATDADNDIPTYSIAGGADKDLFQIDAKTGALTFKAAPNFEAPTDADRDNAYSVLVKASDLFGGEDTQLITVSVTDNKAPVITSNGGLDQSVSIDEGQAAVTTVTASDTEGDPIVFAIAGGEDRNQFQIDPTTGALSFQTGDRNFEAPQDANRDNVYKVLVQASNGEGSDTQLISVTVNNIDEAPEFNSGNDVVIEEGYAGEFSLGAYDPDNDPLTYTLSGADAQYFNLNPVTGGLSFKSPVNYETDQTGYSVTFTASAGGKSVTGDFNIYVYNINEAPVITSAPSITVDENATVVTTIAAQDADGPEDPYWYYYSDSPVIYYLGGGADADLFDLNIYTGELTFKAAPDAEAPGDAGKDNVYNVTVYASDLSAASSQDIVITVRNVNEAAPAITSNGGEATASVTMAENTTAVTKVVAIDTDAGTTLTYALSGDDAAKFQINAATGQLGFRNVPSFETPTDVGGDNTYNVTVTASDGTLTDTQDIAVTVADVAEGAAFTALGKLGPEILVNTNTSGRQYTPSLAGLEGGGYVVVWTDLDSKTLGDTSSGAIKAQLYAADGTAVGSEFLINTFTPGNQIDATVTALKGGGFAVTWSGPSNDSFDILGQVFNASGGKVGSEFTVNPATPPYSSQYAPTITGLSGGGFVVTWWDADSGTGGDSADSIKAQIYAANGTKVGAEFRVNTVTAGGQFEPSIASLANGGFVVTWNSDEGTSGPTHDVAIKAQVYSATGVKVGSEFLVNTANGGTQQKAEVTGLPDGHFVVVWEDESGVGGDSSRSGIKAQLFEADGTKIGGEILVNTFTSDYQRLPRVAALANGDFVVTWNTANDGSGTSVSAQVFRADGSKVGTEFTANTSTTFTQQNPAVTGLADGSFAIAWQDDSASAAVFERSFDIRVQVFGNNTPPTITSDGGGTSASVSAPENSTATITTVVAEDANAGTKFTYGLSGADANKFNIAANGALSFKTGQNFEVPGDSGNNGVYNVTVTVSDGTLTDTQDIAVTLTDANEAPVITSNGGNAAASVTVRENSTAVTRVIAADPDLNPMLTYSVSGADAALFDIDAETGVLTFKTAPNYEAPADAGQNNVYDVTVTASDGTLSDTQDIAVTVGNVKEASDPAVVKSGSEFKINTTTSGNQTSPVITSLANGGFAVAWVDNSGLGGDADATSVKTEVFDAAGTLISSEILVNTRTSGDQVGVKIGSLANGGFVVTWEVYNGEEIYTDISGQIFSATGAKVGTEFRANSNLIEYQYDSSVIGLAGGGFVVVWGDNSGPGLSGRVFTDTGSGVGSAFKIKTNAVGGEQRNPSVTALANGGFVVAWQDNGSNGDGSGFSIKAQVYGPNATKVGTELLVNTQTSLAQEVPSVAALPDNGFVVTWTDTSALGDGSGSSIKAQRFDASGAAIGSEFVVNTSKNGDQLSAKVTSFPDGVFIVTWTDNSGQGDGSVSGIKGQAYFADGTKNGGEFLVNTTTYNQQQFSGVAALADGRFAAVWQDNSGQGGDASGYGLKAQLFDVPTHPPAIASNGGGATATVAVAENGTAVTTVRATDLNAEDTVTYAITGGADQARFAIDKTTGVLRFIDAQNFEAPLDADGDGVYNVTVTASDGLLSDSQAIAVSLSNVNEFIGSNGGVASAAVSVLENTTAVTTVSVRNGYVANGALTYAVSGADAALFAIDANTGVLTFKSAPNFEAPGDAGGNNTYDVFVGVRDNGVLIDVQALAITVGNVNEAPVFTSGASNSGTFAENAGGYALVTPAVDPEGANVNYTLSGDDAARFQVEPGGSIRFRSSPNFEAPTDKSGDNVYDLIVTADDGTGKTSTQTVSITVTDVDEAPVISTNGGNATAPVSVAENSTAVTTVQAQDPEKTAVAYSISGGADAALFEIDPSTGVLRFIDAPNFEVKADVGANNVYDVIVAATSAGKTDTQAIAVTVTNVNEAPVFAGGDTLAQTVAENYDGYAGGNYAIDPDNPGVQLGYFYTLSGTDANRFTVEPGGGIRYRGNLDFENPNDADGDNIYELILTVKESENPGALSDTQIITIEVTDVEENPVITSDGGNDNAAPTVAENETLVTTVRANDPEKTTVTFEITGGADSDLFEINSSTGELRFKTAPDFETRADSGADNIYNVTVTATDAAGREDTQGLAITVTNVNEAPAITSNGAAATASVTIDENTTAATIVTASDVDAKTTLVYSLTGADAGKFDINQSNGALTFKTAPNFEARGDADRDNVYDVVVRVSDGQLSDTQAISVTVADVNEAPVITSNGGSPAGTVSAAENGTSVTTVRATDPDAGASLAFSITGGADASKFDIDRTTGVLTFKSAQNFEAPGDNGGDNVYDVTITVSDGALSDTQTLAVTLTDINDAPTISSNGAGAAAAVSVAENGTVVTTVAAGDQDPGTTITYGIAGGVDAGKFDIDPTTGELTFKTAPNFEVKTDTGGNNVYDVIVSASDGTLTDTQAIAVTVTNVNETPVIVSNGGSPTGAVSLGENATSVTTIQTIDPDAGTTWTYTITGGADRSLFTIDASTGALSFKTAPNYEAAGDVGRDNVYDVSVTVSDGQLSDTQALAVTVTNVNEAPVITSDGGGTSATLVVDEKVAFGTQVVATDPDSSTTITYSIAGGADAARFEIDPVTGQLAFVTEPNIEAPSDAGGDNIYDVVVKASDGTGIDALSDTQALSIEVWRIINGTPNVDRITGTTGGDHIFGLASNDVISGLGGNDVIDGGTGVDRMTGGTGNDTYVVDNVLDRVTEVAGEGTDTVQTGVDKYTLADTLENLTFNNSAAHYGIGNAAINTMIGNAGADKLTALGGNDLLQGLGGSDQLYGGAGNDRLEGGEGADKMIGGEGDDVYIVDNVGDFIIEGSNKGNDVVYASASHKLGSYVETLILTGSAAINGTGGNQANTIQGNGAANVLNGGKGNDVLAGGLGNDTLIGGKGADTFLFDSLPGAGNVDLVSDFLRTQLDVIQLSKADFAGLGAVGALGSAAFFSSATATAANDATDRIVYNTTSGALYYDADGLGGQAAVQIATFGTTTHPSLLFSDFQIVA